MSIAHLKERPSPSTPTAPPSGFSSGIGVRSAAVRILSSNGSRALSFVGGNGGSKSVSASKGGSLSASSSTSLPSTSNFDGKGIYLIFNVGDAIFISDLNSQDKVFRSFLI